MNFTYNPNQIALYDEQDKLLAEVTFPDTADGAADIDHTFVDDSLQGQGIASACPGQEGCFDLFLCRQMV